MLPLEPLQHAVLELPRCRVQALQQVSGGCLQAIEVVVVLQDEIVDLLGRRRRAGRGARLVEEGGQPLRRGGQARSEEHTSELQSLMRISSAVFCLKKNNKQPTSK